MGAVGGIRNIKDGARAAALVKDNTKHSFLIGEQAGTFAAQMGLPWSSLTTQVRTFLSLPSKKSTTFYIFACFDAS